MSLNITSHKSEPSYTYIKTDNERHFSTHFNALYVLEKCAHFDSLYFRNEHAEPLCIQRFQKKPTVKNKFGHSCL